MFNRWIDQVLSFSTSQDSLEEQQLAVGHQKLTGFLQTIVTGCIWSFHAGNSLATHSFTHAIAFGRISMGRQKGSEFHHQGKFLHNYYDAFESMHDGTKNDTHDLFRIFVGLFCKLCGFFIYVTSGNGTPGSRFYSDLLDTSVCINQLVLKCHSKR